MSEGFQIAVGSILAVLYGLSALSRRFPHVAWLQHFRITRPQLTEEQQARMRRRVNVSAGAQLILFGLILPLGYLVLTVMTFSAVRTGTLALVLAGSVLCIVLGITAIVQSGRR
jgi:integral membrane sensor domain MASE1